MNISQALHLLGLKEITDEKTIKKAYAIAVSKHHPEEEPEVFAQLKEAYHQLLKEARQDRISNLESMQKQGEIMAEDKVRYEGAFEETSSASVFLSDLCALLQEGDVTALKAFLYNNMQTFYEKDETVLHGLCAYMQEEHGEIPFSMRHVLIKAFKLANPELTADQKKLYACIQKDDFAYACFRLSPSRDWDYLYETWVSLTTMEDEDTQEWLLFLHSKNWNEDDISEEQASAILQLEMEKSYAHSSVVAGKIYSFLHIREHVSHDEHQVYARLKLVLSKDSDACGESFLEWKARIYGEYQQLMALGCQEKEIRTFLRAENRERDDLVLLELLTQSMKHRQYSKRIWKMFCEHYRLDTQDYLHQQLLEVMHHQEERQQYQIIRNLFLVLLALVVVILVYCAALNKQKEKRRKEELMEEIEEHINDIQKQKSQELEDKIKKMEEATKTETDGK